MDDETSMRRHLRQRRQGWATAVHVPTHLQDKLKGKTGCGQRFNLTYTACSSVPVRRMLAGITIKVIVASRALRLAQRQAPCWGIRWRLLQAGYGRTGAGGSSTCGTRVIGCRNPPLIPNSKRYFNVVPLRGFSHRALSTIRR